MDNDRNTTIQEPKNLLIEFRDARDWAQFHDPKNLAEAISIEAAELLELFLWKSPEEVATALKIEFGSQHLNRGRACCGTCA